MTARDVLPILPGSHAVAPPAAAPNRQQSPILPADLTDEEIVGRWLRAKATGRGRLAAMTLAQYRIEAERLFWYAHQIDVPISSWTIDEFSGYLATVRTLRRSISWECLAIAGFSLRSHN